MWTDYGLVVSDSNARLVTLKILPVAASKLLYHAVEDKLTDPCVVTGHTSVSLPHIGSVTNKPVQFIIAGFNGHGTPVIYLAAKGIAQMFRDGMPMKRLAYPLSSRQLKTLFLRKLQIRLEIILMGEKFNEIHDPPMLCKDMSEMKYQTLKRS